MHIVTFTALAEFPDRLAAHFTALPAEYHDWQPASWAGNPCGELTALAQLRLILANEIHRYQPNLTRILNENHPTLSDDLPAAETVVETETPDDILTAFRTARKRTLSILEGLSEDQWNRTAILGDRGETTVLGLIHFLTSHDLTQLAGLQWLQGEANLE